MSKAECRNDCKEHAGVDDEGCENIIFSKYGSETIINNYKRNDKTV